MNIVIFGASGFVGHSLVPFLIQQQHHVTTVNRKECSIPSVTSIIVNSFFDVHLYYSAILKADVVIYLAGLAHITSKNSFKNLALIMISVILS